MDLCCYAYYKPEEKYCPNLWCNLDDKRCIYSKKCLKVDKFIPLEGEKWKECYKFIMEKRKNIPKGSSLVQTFRPNRAGKLYLYVVTDKGVERILTNFTELNQEYVYIRKTPNDSYEVSLVPFQYEIVEEVEQNTIEENIEKTEQKKEEVVTVAEEKKTTTRKTTRKRKPKTETKEYE